jgi:putative PIN family toxin of toxin-antitoxin system
MRVLLDVNILIRYLLTPHPQSPILSIVEAGISGKYTLLTSPELMKELLHKAHAKPYLVKKISHEILEKFIYILMKRSTYITATQYIIPRVVRDPKDDYLITNALIGKADYLVTADKDLLVLGKINNLKILTPEEFLKLLLSTI